VSSEISHDTEDVVMDREQMRLLMEEYGLQPIDNALMAGRMPPDNVCGIHPAGFQEECAAGHVLSEVLLTDLGTRLLPLPDPKVAFNQAGIPPENHDPSISYSGPKL
jgi:hypothetical protein